MERNLLMVNRSGYRQHTLIHVSFCNSETKSIRTETHAYFISSSHISISFLISTITTFFTVRSSTGHTLAHLFFLEDAAMHLFPVIPLLHDAIHARRKQIESGTAKLDAV